MKYFFWVKRDSAFLGEKRFSSHYPGSRPFQSDSVAFYLLIKSEKYQNNNNN